MADKAMPPRAVVLDWDNTLVDSWRVIHQVLAETFVAMDRDPWSYAETRTRVRRSAREVFPHLFGDRAPEAMEVFYSSFERRHLENLSPLPGAEELLRAIAGQEGIFLSLLSNKRGDLLRREVQHLGWEHFFDAVVGANDAARDKPWTEALDLALGQGGQAAGGVDKNVQVWIVGDTDIDMECAWRHGCAGILIHPEQGHAGAAFEGPEPSHRFPDCTAFHSFLRQRSIVA